MTLNEIEKKHAPWLLSTLRIVAALIMFEHGSQKLFDFPPNSVGFPRSALSDAAGVIEIVGSVPLFFGLLARPIAFLFAGEMAFAYFLRHFPRGFYPVNNGGDLAVVLCFLFLFISAAGPGSWSLDALRRAKQPGGRK